MSGPNKQVLHFDAYREESKKAIENYKKAFKNIYVPTSSEYGSIVSDKQKRDDYFPLRTTESYDPNHPYWKFYHNEIKKSASKDWSSTYSDLGNPYILCEGISKDGTYLGLPVLNENDRNRLRNKLPRSMRM